MIQMENYTLFASDNPELDFSFLYPATWRVSEIKQSNYSQVLIRGPRNQQDTFSTALSVTVKSANTMSLEEVVTDYIRKVGQSRGFRLLSTTKGVLAESEAIEMLISYTIALPLKSIRMKDTLILERSVIVKRGTRIYEIVYRTVEEDYRIYLKVFEHAVRTFEFADEVKEFRPLVVPTHKLTVAETKEEYNAKN